MKRKYIDDNQSNHNKKQKINKKRSFPFCQNNPCKKLKKNNDDDEEENNCNHKEEKKNDDLFKIYRRTILVYI